VAAASDIREAYQTYGPALMRKAERILGSSEDAEDVVHALFTDLYRDKSKRLTDLPYLYRAVTNRCLNVVRDTKRRRALLDRQPAPVPEPRLDRRALDIDLLHRLTERLDGKAMETLICRFIDEMTQDEIAEHLGVSRKTVGKRLARIREVLASIAETEVAG
jgi:RNA polymerase sigma-70 factor (ECF subfamily)